MVQQNLLGAAGSTSIGVGLHNRKVRPVSRGYSSGPQHGGQYLGQCREYERGASCVWQTFAERDKPTSSSLKEDFADSLPTLELKASNSKLLLQILTATSSHCSSRHISLPFHRGRLSSTPHTRTQSTYQVLPAWGALQCRTSHSPIVLTCYRVLECRSRHMAAVVARTKPSVRHNGLVITILHGARTRAIECAEHDFMTLLMQDAYSSSRLLHFLCIPVGGQGLCCRCHRLGCNADARVCDILR